MNEKKEKKVITRIAPSPTGAFHIGTARTALFNYLFAKQNNGTFIVRFEDTDRERSEKKHEEDIIKALEWLGMHPDVIARQSDRTEVYKTYIDRLLQNKKAYVSKEPAKKDPSREVEVIRFKNTEGRITFTDTVRGEITVDISDLGDFVIARGKDDPLYNLAVVADDLEMGVTHVLRGDDHITNTPRQIALSKALGESPPRYTHIPLIHAKGGGKLSKRKDAASVNAFKQLGYLPEAVLNTIALLGWSTEDDREFFTREELIETFTFGRIQKKEAVFDEQKLKWFNKHYIKQMPESQLRREIEPEILKRFPIRSRIRPRAVKYILSNIRERGIPFEEEREQIRTGEYDMYFTTTPYDPEMLIPKKNKKEEFSANTTLKGLEKTQSLLKEMSAFRNWNAESIKKHLWEHAEKEGKSQILWPLRVALSGKEKSADPFSIASAIGKKQTLARIDHAMAELKKMTQTT